MMQQPTNGLKWRGRESLRHGRPSERHYRSNSVGRAPTADATHRSFEGHEAEAAAPLGRAVNDHHGVDHLAELPEEVQELLLVDWNRGDGRRRVSGKGRAT